MKYEEYKEMYNEERWNKRGREIRPQVDTDKLDNYVGHRYGPRRSHSSSIQSWLRGLA